MIFYKNFLGIILIIGLILSISPITAYSIETKNNDNCNMNVLAQADSVGSISSNKNSNKDNDLEVNTINNETRENLLGNPLNLPLIVQVIGGGLEIIGLGLCLSFGGLHNVVIGGITALQLGMSIYMIGMFVDILGKG